MLSGRCAVPDSWTRISRIERIFDSSRRFCFPTDYTDFHRFLTPREVFAVSLSEYRCLQRRESVQICEICGRLFLNHIAKIQHFIFPTHRCSLLLTDTHRLSLINIRVLPNGRKYRILAEDWTPCCSWCIHSSATARRAGCILLSISSDGLLPRPGRNPENRAGLTPAWCNFVNPFSIMLSVECWILNTNLSNLTNLSFSRNWTRITRMTRIWPLNSYDSFDSCNSCSEKTIRNSCSVKTVRNSRAEKYLLGLCFINMILSHRKYDT